MKTKWLKSILAFVFGACLAIPAFAEEGSREMCVNGDFSSGTLDPWRFIVVNGAEGTCKIAPDGPDQKQAAVINVTTPSPSGEAWSVSLEQRALNISTGKKYRLTFQVKGSNVASFNVIIGPAHAPWGRLPGVDAKAVAPTDTWQKVAFEFTAASDEPNARVLFYHLNAAGVMLCLADISLVELP